MEPKERNLLSVKAEFHDKGKAARGYNNIMNLINNRKEDDLGYLLRFHDPIGVYGQELIERFEIDALIEYYNLLLVAIFAGYVPGRFDKESAKEILATIKHPSVIPYYSEYYEYKMTSYTVRFVEQNRFFEQEGNPVTISAFNEFISLNRFLKRDEDIKRFLGMLDYVWYSDDSLNDVIEILSSQEKLNAAFASKVKTEAESAVFGFFKYTSFLSDFRQLLMRTEKYPLLQSSFWMFHGYYFDRMNINMRTIFDKIFTNLTNSLYKPEIFYNVAKEAYNTKKPKNIQIFTMEDYAARSISWSYIDIAFVLDKKWAKPLQMYFEHTLPAEPLI
ncbi:hypothetical protein [Flavobacterium sp. CF136]|uniref:hypothetical protein n=1 Tax=Flavobacterium sp. (strain CF136) TaxID=1144313 RepID=UPI0002718576|nr:hypothetical protein [Flavobacterium sp. CF136]EJL62762.1 hypothetical protein PMI10_02719 [Flavobacterium sp. CF136]